MSSKTKIVKFLVELSRIIVGATFLFSGFVKAVDPLGFTYKIEDYLIELGLTHLFPLALPAAVFMVTAEFALGVFLLLGIYRKWVVRLIFVFMVFFTPLTLWIAIANPVEDCGCFGDAFVISNWQTFYKNIILLAGVILLLLKWEQITPFFSKKIAPVAALLTLLFGVLFSLHNVYRLPVFDFRPYKVGANIPQQMFVDPEKADVLETVFIYSKDGVEEEFTEENYPWNDSTWTFVEMKTKLVKEGEKPAIEDFAVESLYYDEAGGDWNIGGDITDIILSEPSYTFLMVAYSLEKMNLKHLERFKEVHRYAEENGYSFYLLTSSSADMVGEWEEHHRTGFQFCHADERVLKTMIRANPGLMLLKEGTVIDKWDGSRVPGKRWLEEEVKN
ncbi:BT_3928 family protein [Proteiniphilum saccharofermentans]|uniref:BT_3928 family protein n=1 Tax=Proteiniphilum saccharofermentans TaxID=1642647 RepID=UPI0028ADCDF1|nr:BT_3928 family protein [Proteiniphilum saccharofermentans]